MMGMIGRGGVGGLLGIAASAFVGINRVPGLLAGDLAREPVPRHRVHPEGREQLADDVVRRQVAVLELAVVGHELLLDEVPHRRPNHLLLVSPFDHTRDSTGRLQTDTIRGRSRVSGRTVAGAPGDGIL